MSRLPTPGSDNGVWGQILNDFLSVEHNTDGTLKSSGSIASKANDSAVVHLAGAETITGAKTFNAGTFRDKGNHDYNAIAYAGVDNTGATDSAAALQTAIDASPFGSRWYLPPGVYRFDSTLTLNRGRSLVGSGYYHFRDGTSGFADSGWGTAGSPSTFMVGTVIYSSVTSGAAIQVTANGANNAHIGSQLKDFILVGPGSGTSSGLAMGEPTVPTPRVVLRPNVQYVKVCNFATGLLLEHVNEARFDVAVQGCTKAVSAVFDVNNVSWNQLNMQRCTDGLVFEGAENYTNVFIAPICQNVTTGFTIRGEGHTITSPYFEEVPTIATHPAATLCAMHNPTVQGSVASAMTIAAGSNFNQFWGLKLVAGGFTITNAASAVGNLFHGILGSALADSGSNSWRMDVNAATVQFPRYQSSTTTGPTMQFGSAWGWRFGASGAQGWQGAGSPEGSITAPVGSAYFRTDGGAGTTLYIKESGTGNTGWVAK